MKQHILKYWIVITGALFIATGLNAALSPLSDGTIFSFPVPSSVQWTIFFIIGLVWAALLSLYLMMRKQEPNNNISSTPQLNNILRNCNQAVMIETLKNETKSKKGKHIALIIRTLIDLDYIDADCTKSSIINAFRSEFGYIGSNESINKYLSGRANHFTEEEYQRMRAGLRQ